MLFLHFSVDNDNFVIDTGSIVEIIPKLPTQAIQTKIPYLLGVQTIRQKTIPVFDLCLLFSKRCTNEQYTSRTVVLKNQNTTSSLPYIGILAEKMCETLNLEHKEFFPLEGNQYPFILEGCLKERRLYQKIDVQKFFDTEEKKLHQLFLENSEVAPC